MTTTRFHEVPPRVGAIAAALLSLALLGAAAPVCAGTIVVDHGSPDFYAQGQWIPSTAGTPTFVGGSHLVAQPLPSYAVIDNTSPQFSTFGSWSQAATLPGRFGTNYAAAPHLWSAPLSFPTVIVDNRSSSKTPRHNRFSSSWNRGDSVPGVYGRDFAHSSPTASSKIANFVFALQGYANLGNEMPATVSAWWPADPGNASNTVIRLTQGGTKLIAQWVVNQQQGGGQWNALGTVQLDPGVTYYLAFDATAANGRVVADAVKIESTNPANSARWQLPNYNGDYDVFARWPAQSGSEVFVGWTIVGGDGSDAPSGSTSQRSYGGEWRKMGTVHLGGKQPNYAQVLQFGRSSLPIQADAVAVVPRYSFPIATWKAAMVGSVVVRATWAADASRAGDAKYVIHTYGANCAPQSRLVTVDQRIAPPPGGYVLGTVTNTGECTTQIEVQLMPETGIGTLSADSVSFTQ